MSAHTTWYVARAGGLVAWGLLVASMLWGLLYATRLLGRRAAPWWLFGVHRFLGGLALVFVGIHVGALLLDDYVGFGPADVLVPGAAAWHPVAVAWGVVATYALVAVETTSLLRRRLPHRLWRGVHLASYPLFAFATIHALASGTDVAATFGDGLLVALGAVAVAVAVVGLDRRALVRSVDGPDRAPPGPPPG
jgi:hypothetical protein